ncbi:conserved phage C-terminal domain-containing protein [Alcanivorax jadensis]|uniref:conserved phage C-terminal domain-containing protein n=1 Tax=Alcanivorax jadensis TaxID=64988 RepID=UPI002357E659|nr:conserved phage C-terminal domain-containing protein [Alcanivorax jadensis]|tara:strand:+ start:1088 stop:1867 length:780 start_codon:yes stop_codon:yes gene_type:complete
MAGDWIKMRSNLWDDPRVARLCDLTDQGEAAVIGGLYWLWAAADQHTEDGFMAGLSLRQIDRKTGVQGFGQAVVDVGWMKEECDGIQIVNFDDHNGASAKRRSMEAKRKAYSRKSSASDADKRSTKQGHHAELEKEKEKEKEKELKIEDGDASLALAHLNEICGTKYSKTKTNLGPINARMTDGATLDDVKAVINFKHREWSGDPKMAQYLRPDTLFRPTKFPGYLAAAKAKAVPKDPGHNQPGYDPDLSRATDMSGFD